MNQPALSTPVEWTQFLQFGKPKGVSLILQSEAAECGLACLVMVANFHGTAISMASARRVLGIGLRGATLERLVEIADKLGLQPRPLALELNELSQLKLPCVLHWEMKHFVVLSKVDETLKHVEIFDPASGKRTVSTAELSKCFTGVALELSPLPNATKLSVAASERFDWKAFFKIAGAKRSAAMLLSIALVLEVLTVLVPLMTQLAIDGAIGGRDGELLKLIAIGLIAIVVFQVALTYARSKTITFFGSQINVQWTYRVLSHLTHLPLEYFQSRGTGEISSRFDALQRIQHALTLGVVETALDGILGLLMIVLVFLYSWQIGAIALCMFAGHSVLILSTIGESKRAAGEQLAFHSYAKSQFLETLRTMQSVKVLQAEGLRSQAFMAHHVESMNRGHQHQALSIRDRCIALGLHGTQTAMVLYVGCMLIFGSQLSIGMYFACTMYLGTFTARSRAFLNHIVDLKNLTVQLDRLEDIVGTKAEEPHVRNEATWANDSMSTAPILEARGLGYKYPGETEWVFRNVSFKLETGESLAIRGGSGTGKTTFLKILLGLVECTEGELIYCGMLVSKNVGQFRQDIAAVMQDDVLFSGTILENVAAFALLPNHDRVKLCLHAVGMTAEIQKYPMGLNTLVGEMGGGLSGGQKQRLLIARALYRQPKLVFLDEATNSLDDANQTTAARAVANGSASVIEVAHRHGVLNCTTYAKPDHAKFELGIIPKRQEQPIHAQQEKVK